MQHGQILMAFTGNSASTSCCSSKHAFVTLTIELEKGKDTLRKDP